MRLRVVYDEGCVAVEVADAGVSLARGNRALDARVGAVRLGLGLRGPEVRVSRPRVACDVDRDAAPAPAPAPRKSGWGAALRRRAPRQRAAAAAAPRGGPAAPRSSTATPSRPSARRPSRAAPSPSAPSTQPSTWACSSPSPTRSAGPGGARRRRGGSGAAAPWVAFGAVVALMLALWPLGGLALVALALYGVAFPRPPGLPFEVSATCPRAAVSFAKPDLAARFEARDLRGDGSGAGAASVAFSLTRFGVEVLAGGARETTLARRDGGWAAALDGLDLSRVDPSMGRGAKLGLPPALDPDWKPSTSTLRLSVALTGECRARFYRQRRGVDTYRAALVLRGGASFEVDVANGRYAATLVDPLANDWNGRAMIREGVLELAFDGYKKDRGFPVFTATLKETRFVYEHHFIAEFLRWLFAIWPAGSGRYGGTPELVIRGERVALTLPESRRRLAAVRFDCRSLVAVRRGIKGVVAVPGGGHRRRRRGVRRRRRHGGLSGQPLRRLREPGAAHRRPAGPAGHDRRHASAPSPERRSSLAFLPAASGAPQKLQFTHEIVVELSVSKKVELALTRDQYACAVALFFGNMGEDDGDGATAKWWQETPYGAGAPGRPEAWFASGTAPHALAATLGCSWKVEVAAARASACAATAPRRPSATSTPAPAHLPAPRLRGRRPGERGRRPGFLRVLEPGARRAAWAEATPRRGSTNALTYDHRTNCAANWVGVWLGALAVRAPPSRVRAVVGFLFGGFRRAQRCVPRRPVDAYATFFEHWQSELVVDFGDVVWEQRGAAGPRAASVDVKSARITRVVTETTTRIAVRASLRGPFCRRRGAGPCGASRSPASCATTARGVRHIRLRRGALRVRERGVAGREGGPRGRLRRRRRRAGAARRRRRARARRPGARGARGRRHALGASPWAADLGRVDLSPPAHADSRGTFAARVVVRAHALAFRARRPRAELAVALTGAFDGSPSLSATAALDARGDVRRGNAWEPAVDPFSCGVEVARTADGRTADGVAGGDDGLVGDDGASSDDESDGGRAGDGGDDGVFLAAVSASSATAAGPGPSGPRARPPPRVDAAPAAPAGRRVDVGRRDGRGARRRPRRHAAGRASVRNGCRDCALGLRAIGEDGAVLFAATAPPGRRVAAAAPGGRGPRGAARGDGVAALRGRRGAWVALEPRQLRGDYVGAFRAGGLACRAAATRDDRGGAAVAQEASTRAAGIAVSAEDHFGTEEQPAVTLGALLVAGDEDHFSRAPPARTTSRDAAPEPDDDDAREARPWSVEISLGPLLVFRNGLPVPLAWELVGGGHRRGVLPADAEAPYRGDAPSVSLRVRIANYAWSPPLEIALRDVFDAPTPRARPPAAARGPAAARRARHAAPRRARRDAAGARGRRACASRRRCASSSPSTRRAPWSSAAARRSRICSTSPRRTARAPTTSTRSSIRRRGASTSSTGRASSRSAADGWSSDDDGGDGGELEEALVANSHAGLLAPGRAARPGAGAAGAGAAGRRVARTAPPVAFATDAAARRALVADWGAVVPWDPCAAARRVATEPIRVVFCDASKAPVDLPPPARAARPPEAPPGGGGGARATTAPRRVDDADSGGKSAPHTHRAAREADAAAASLSLNCPRPRGRVPASYELSVAVAADGAGAAPRRALATLLPRVTVRNGLADCVLEVGQVAVDGGDHVLRLRPRAEGQLRWASASAPRLVSVRATFRGGAALVSGALRVDGFGRRGETAFKLHDPAGVAAPVLCRLRREPRARRPDDGGGGRRTGDDTLAVIERADERWPPYRIANGTSRVVRYRQKLGSATFGLAVADFDGELAISDGDTGDAVVAELAHAGRSPGREALVATRTEAQGGVVLAPIGRRRETSPTFAAKRPSSTLGAAAETLEKNAHSLRDALVGGAASALLGGDPKAPRRKSTYASEAYESAQSTAKYLGSKVHKGARKMGVVAASHEEQTVAPWTELRPNDEHVYAWERPLDAIGYGSKSYRRALQVEFYDATRDEWGSNLNLKRRYAGAEVVSVEVWSERLSAFGFLTSRLPLVTRLVAEEFLVPDAGGGFSTAGYALADRDADADRASSPYVCVASPKDGVLASLKAKDAAAARRWVADLRDAVDGAGRVDARLTLDDVASSSRVVCVVRADGPTKVLEISEEA
ncbi:hypothetical protein JL722_8374 [Aureococcus anophagefferens]|nr:hypothetical protein JL722_8374 [Aureococcus anophagefferens]